ncbi:crotonase/enoyl-CoA hydratase family protein [Altererythrobacter arenosus]|uniref:Crotonase/enoyl-CoA hydratase family protein n=1 Tax=Altererythrobacter arenosus TaxID=3032592 RepID=A0ABY8FXU9_9SPHN|nr:crotonase/enoyl-CoA hydratase family protein [Altererythrobacter sp. CAU 1644]WFL76819.1 crotonase/enoyl-CoA hydratase family protein [Altererythrobacter sp. CAU 1644]
MTVSYRRDGPVAIVTIERPERRNAVDRNTAEALFDAFERFDAEEDASVAILTGAGGAFCAGADLKAISEGDGNGVSETGRAPMGPSRMRLTKPVIAAIEGHAVAGGMELALWCDLRVMAEDAIMGIFCRRFGVPLVDMGTIRLPRLIGHSRAMDLMLTGRPVDAEEALAIGLANRLAPPGLALDHAIALAKEIAAFPQTCLRGDLRSAREQWSLTEEEAIVNEIRIGQQTIASGETRTGATRFRDGTGRHGAFS